MKIKSIFLLLICLLLFTCSKETSTTTEHIQTDEEVSAEVESLENVYSYSDYILEYTEGIISIKDDIRVKFNIDSPDFKGINKIDVQSLFDIRGVKGKYEFRDDGLLIFTPDKEIEYNRTLSCKVNITEAFENVIDDLNEFSFKLRTKKLYFDVEIGDLLLSPGNKANSYSLTGVVEFSDWFDESVVEKAFSAKLSDKSLTPKWSHKETKHSFTINDIERGKENQILEINIDGKKHFGLSKVFNKKVDILPIGVFSFLKHRVERGANKVVVLNFTSTLLAKQQFSSLVSVTGDRHPRVSVSGSQLKIYPQNVPRGEIKVVVKKGLKSSARQNLKKDIVLNVVLEQEYPEVKMIGSNGIVTGDKALFFPFSAVSLRAVDVRIIEIFENNLVQYLQDNKLAKGTKNLRKVAKPIYQGSVSLNIQEENNLMVWNRYHINLDDFIDVNPGSVYQVELSFRRSQSLYGDPEFNKTVQDEMKDQKWSFEERNERSNWDYYGDYYYNNNWQDRKDPSKDAYYTDPNKIKRRVVFASNLGIVAKRSDYGDLWTYVTDINTADFVKSAKVIAYNYQQQEIAQGTTDSEGKVILDLNDEIPFVVSVKRDKDVGYLRLEDGSALNVSTFDTSGKKNPKGLKGYMYGERGVWRPGDKVYLHFIFEDEQRIIPQGHPIVLEVKNSKGAIVHREIRKKGNNPIYPFVFETNKDDPTGNWNAQVKIGDRVFNKTLMIETVKPNRLKIDLDFGVGELTKEDDTLLGDLQVDWLHGAPGKNLKAEFDVSYRAVKTAFKGWGEYIFDDPSVKLNTSKEEFFKGRVDEKGYAEVPLNLNSKLRSPGKVMVNFSGKAYEEGGDFSIKNFSIPYFPYETFIGLRVPKGDKSRDMLLTDVDHEISIVTVNSKGEAVSKDNLTVELYKIDWKWWWDQAAYSQVPNFVSTRGHSLIQSGKVSTKDGTGSWKLNVKYPSWGRYYLRVKDGNSGHSTGRVVYIDWPGWAGRSIEGDGGASRLLFSTDKDEYSIGEDIGISFPSSQGGKALISIENGMDIISARWIDTIDGETKTTIKATKEMFPGAYIHITLIQPREYKANDRPLRLYGILPVKVLDNNSILEPVINMEDSLRPNKPVDISISEKSGKEMYYTLAVVDDGLLDLTNFVTPNAYGSFFAREALGVKTWDIYNQIVGDSINDYGSLLAIGGGGSEDDDNKKEANRFKPVVKVLGPFKLEAGEKKSHSFIMPNYIGSVRTMVTAANFRQYGAAEKTTPVKEPLMVLGTMPRVLGPKERVLLPVTVFSLDENIKSVEVSVKAEGQLKLKGDNSQVIEINGVGEEVVYFELGSLDDLGYGKVTIDAKSGKHSSNYEVEINIRPSNPVITKSQGTEIMDGESHSFSVTPWGYEGSRSMTLEISSIPPINLDERLKYLIRYPHGCIEQTTSGVFPQLYLEKLKDLTDEEKSKINKNIEAGIERLGLFTTNSGGLAYWPGNSEPSEWGSTYAGHFLIEADRAGYSIPESLIEDWANYQSKVARDYKGDSDLNQAYRLYTLALYGEPEIGAMNRLFENEELSIQARWRLAATYGLTGNKEAAEKLTRNIGYDIKDYKATSSSYGSAIRDKAMILETYSILDKNGYKIVDEISTVLSSKRGLSTQTTAYALMAISKYGEGDSSGINAAVDIDGEKLLITSDKNYYSSKINYSKNITVENTSNGRAYISLLTEGVEIEGEEETSRNGLGLDVEYIIPDNESLDSLPSGTNFKAKIKVKNLTAELHEEIALSVLIPGGWEIINNRLSGGETHGESDYEYKDIRDDRVYYYFDLTAGEERTYFVELNASYQGEFYMPAISVESMYNSDVKAIQAGEWIQVVPGN